MTSSRKTAQVGPVLRANTDDRMQPLYPLPPLRDEQPILGRLKRARQPAIALGFLLMLIAVSAVYLSLRLDRPILGPVPDETTMGAVLASGGLYHVDAEQLDHRALVASRIRHMTQTPDVVVVADRSWQLLQQDLRWKKRVFGAYVDGLKPSDVASILGQLSRTGHMPKKIILGIAPDYVIRTGPVLTLASVDSIAGDVERVALAATSDSRRQNNALARDPAHRPRPGLAPYDAKLDTIYPDGSVVWSVARTRDMAGQNHARIATGIVSRLRQKVRVSTFSQIVETGEIIADAKSQGVEVVIALTPLHPAVYGQIYNRQIASRLHEGIEDLLAMARALDVDTLGSFEPFAAGCRERDFASVTVPAPACLSRLLKAGFVVGADDQARLRGFHALTLQKR